MAASETDYSVPVSSPRVLARERAQTTRLAVYYDGALVAPSAGTYVLVDPGGVERISGAVSIVSSVAQYAIAALDLPASLAYGEGYSERWTLTLGGVARRYRRSATLGRFELAPPLGVAELVAGEYPDLGAQFVNWSGSLQALIDAEWQTVLRALWRDGTPSDVLVEPSEVFDWYRHAALARIFKSLLGTQDNPRWDRLYQIHTDEARSARSGLRITVDRDRSGVVDSLGGRSLVQPVQVNAAPTSRLARSGRW